MMSVSTVSSPGTDAHAGGTGLLVHRRTEVLRGPQGRRAAANRRNTFRAHGGCGAPQNKHLIEENKVLDCADGLAITERRIRILIVDDHPVLREGIAAVIKNQSDMALVAEVTNGQEGIQRFRECRPDVTLIGLGLRDMSGIDAMVAIRSEFPDARVIILTAFEGDAPIHRALEAGASAYLLKSIPPGELVDAIRRVHAGEKAFPTDVAAKLVRHIADERLTTRETEVLQHIAGGHGNRSIAEKLIISEETVKTHIRHLMEKLRAGDRTQALAIALQRGFIEL